MAGDRDNRRSKLVPGRVGVDNKKPRSLLADRGRFVVYLLLAGVNLWLAWPWFAYVASTPETFDWRLLSDAVRMANPYDHPNGFPYSPLTILPLQLLTGLGHPAWVALHIPALAPLGRLAPLALLSYPFAFDLATGNVMTFVGVAAYIAFRGNRWGEIGYLGLFLLMPRPLMAPLVLWLLWKRPRTRVPFAVLAVVSGVLVLASGFAFEWIGRLLTYSQILVLDNAVNLSPSQWLGWAWWPIGLALSGVLLWKGRVGLASLAASPYLFPQYLWMLVLELGWLGNDQPVRHRRPDVDVAGREGLGGREDKPARGRPGSDVQRGLAPDLGPS